MGQTLSEPITTKESTSLQNSSVKVGSSCMQGWRVSMEDAHCHILSLGPEDPAASYYAVFDGHGGAKVAHYCANNLHRFILRREEYVKGDVETALKEGFLDCDQAMRVEESLKDEMAGSTAVAVLMRRGQAVVRQHRRLQVCPSVGGVAKNLSVDHKPVDPKERARIEGAGGFVEFNRVNGNLALSRAMGDFVFKMNDKLSASEQIVTCYPDVEYAEVSSEWDFMVLACDGIWDVLSSQEVVDFCLSRLGQGLEPEDVCEELMTRCLSPDCQMGGLGCDNMTCVLVFFLHGESLQARVERMALLGRERQEAELGALREQQPGSPETAEVAEPQAGQQQPLWPGEQFEECPNVT